MAQYRRAIVPGGTFFLTLVTHRRAPIFRHSENVQRLRCALSAVKNERPVDVLAAVVLPDHIHFLWELPADDHDFSSRVGRLKVFFTRSLSPAVRVPQARTQSKLERREASVWQRRFWEHTIRDPEDFQRHLDYIHYNPVKHGLVTCPHAWPHSSFAQCVEQGIYDRAWCCACAGPMKAPPCFEDLEGRAGE